jgi:hypothetical protein
MLNFIAIDPLAKKLAFTTNSKISPRFTAVCHCVKVPEFTMGDIGQIP